MDKDTRNTGIILAALLTGTVVYSHWPETVTRPDGIPNIVTGRDEMIKWREQEAERAAAYRRDVARDPTQVRQ